MSGAVIPFMPRRDRITLAATKDGGFVLAWTPREEPGAWIVVHEAPTRDEALAAAAFWIADGADLADWTEVRT